MHIKEERRYAGFGFCNAGSNSCSIGGMNLSGDMLRAIKSRVSAAADAGLPSLSSVK